MDTQTAILELPSRNALVGLGGNMSLHRDPSAPSATKIDPAVVARDQEFQESQSVLNNQRTEIIKCFGSIKASKRTQQYRDYQIARLQLNSLKAFIKRREEAAAHKDFFMSSSTRYIDEQHPGVLKDFQPKQPTFIFAERQYLIRLLFESHDPNTRTPDELRARRIAVMTNMITLCGHHETRPTPLRTKTDSVDDEIVEETTSLV
jgi:hypothetical protein